MAFKGYQFDRETVTPLGDARLYNFLIGKESGILDGYGNNMAVTINGLIATIDIGMCVICGRLIEITSQHQVSIPANSNGYLCITVDLSQANTSTGDVGTDEYIVINNQIKGEFVTELTMDDLNNGGTLYTLDIGTISSNDSSATFLARNDALLSGVIGGRAPEAVLNSISNAMFRSYDVFVGSNSIDGTLESDYPTLYDRLASCDYVFDINDTTVTNAQKMDTIMATGGRILFLPGDYYLPGNYQFVFSVPYTALDLAHASINAGPGYTVAINEEGCELFCSQNEKWGTLRFEVNPVASGLKGVTLPDNSGMCTIRGLRRQLFSTVNTTTHANEYYYDASQVLTFGDTTFPNLTLIECDLSAGDMAQVNAKYQNLVGSPYQYLRLIDCNPLDTGWIDMPLAQGVENDDDWPLQIKRVGNRGMISGRVTFAAGSASIALATIPDHFKTSRKFVIPVSGSSGATPLAYSIPVTSGSQTLSLLRAAAASATYAELSIEYDITG